MSKHPSPGGEDGMPPSLRKARADQLAPESARELIREIRGIDLRAISLESLKEKLTPLLKGFSLPSPFVQRNTMLYRGVLYRTKPTAVKQVSYPPSHLVGAFGRANRPGSPMFYCGTDRAVPLFELKVQPGDCLAVSWWRVRQKLFVNNVGYTKEVLKQLGAQRKDPDWAGEDGALSNGETNGIVRSFFSEMMMQTIPDESANAYKLCAAIAERHLNWAMFDGLLYPTITMQGNADNLALKPESVDSKLALAKVEYLKISKLEGLTYEFAILDHATSFSADGKVEWKGRPEHFVLRSGGHIIMRVEHGRWVARDIAGRLVPPE